MFLCLWVSLQLPPAFQIACTPNSREDNSKKKKKQPNNNITNKLARKEQEQEQEQALPTTTTTPYPSEWCMNHSPTRIENHPEASAMSSDKIKVAVRVRPFNRRGEYSSQQCAKIMSQFITKWVE